LLPSNRSAKWPYRFFH